MEVVGNLHRVSSSHSCMDLLDVILQAGLRLLVILLSHLEEARLQGAMHRVIALCGNLLVNYVCNCCLRAETKKKCCC